MRPLHPYLQKRVVLALGLAAVAGISIGGVSTFAQAASASGQGKVRIIRPLSVAAPAQMSFGRLQYNAGSGPAVSPVVLRASPPTARTSANVQLLPGGSETPAIRTITGQPGAVYRVVTPASATATPGGLTVNTFTVYSANGGDISATRLGQLNASGTDTIRVGGSLQVPQKTKNDTYTANVAITISYE